MKPCPHYTRETWKIRFNSEKASNLFRPHSAGRIKNIANTGFFLWIGVWGKLGQGNQMLIVTTFGNGAPFPNVFRTNENENPPFSNSSNRFEERFRKASFSWPIRVEGRPIQWNKSSLSNSPYVMRTSPKTALNVVIVVYSFQKERPVRVWTTYPELKMRHAAEYFRRTLRCLEMWPTMALSVWYIHLIRWFNI